jgi:hypothetical protein
LSVVKENLWSKEIRGKLHEAFLSLREKNIAGCGTIPIVRKDARHDWNRVRPQNANSLPRGAGEWGSSRKPVTEKTGDITVVIFLSG